MMKMTKMLFIKSIGIPSQPITPNVHNSPNAIGTSVTTTNSTEASDRQQQHRPPRCPSRSQNAPEPLSRQPGDVGGEILTVEHDQSRQRLAQLRPLCPRSSNFTIVLTAWSSGPSATLSVNACSSGVPAKCVQR